MYKLYNALKAVAVLVTWVPVLAVCGLAAVTAMPRLAGAEPYIVLSGSMEPAVPVDAVAFVADAGRGDGMEPGKGDIIAFVSADGTRVLHRISGYDASTGEYTTKGDANSQDDGTKVHREDIIGKYIWHVPVVGYILAKLDSSVFYFGALKIPAMIPILVGLVLLLNVNSCLLGIALEERERTEPVGQDNEEKKGEKDV